METAQSESKVFSKYGIEFIEKHNDYTHATIVMQWYNEYDLEKNATISRRFNRC